MNNVCAIYARYSSLDELKDGNPRSLTNQIEILTEYANNNHYMIYKIYIDYHESGKTFDTPGVMQLLIDAKGNKFKTIIVKDLSRFGRNYREIDKLLFEEFPKLNIRLISVNESLDSSKDNDSLPISVKNVMNDLSADEKLSFVKEYCKHLEKKFIELTGGDKDEWKLPNKGVNRVF